MKEKIKKYLPSFGRRGGRIIKKSRRESLEEVLKEFGIDKNFAPQKTCKIFFEIGFGGGEHLAHRAEENPEKLFIGCEVYKDGVFKLARQIKEKNLTNIRIFSEDARELLENLPSKSLDGIYLLFPDPWPKARHHKRRIVTLDMLQLIAKKLKKNGKFNFATDHEDYATWTLAQIYNSKLFRFLAKSKTDWLEPPLGHKKTRYQEKEKAGKPVFLNFELAN